MPILSPKREYNQPFFRLADAGGGGGGGGDGGGGGGGGGGNHTKNPKIVLAFTDISP